MTEEQLFNMSDEELEAHYNEALAQETSPDTEIEEELVEEEIEESMEQPEEDSDDDLTTDDEMEEDAEADSETESDELDEEVAEEEEQTEEVEEAVEDEVEEVQQISVRANGKDYNFTKEEMMKEFPRIFGQAMDYTKKTQAMKPWRKTIDAIEQAKVSHDDISLMIDVLKGDKDAIAEVLKRTSVDALDLDLDNSKYMPKDYGRDETTLNVKDVIDELSSDKEFEITQKVLSREWDENSFNELTKDPEKIRGLHYDIKSGLFDKISPIMEKLKVLDRGTKSDLEYYAMGAREFFRQDEDRQRREQAVEDRRLEREAKEARQQELERVRANQTRQAATREKVEKRKAAAPTKSNAGTKKSVIDYLDASDEEYEDWYKAHVTDKI